MATVRQRAIAARPQGRSAAEHPGGREGCPGLHAATAQEAWGSRQPGSCRRWRARPLAAARELPEGRGRVGSATRGVGDMLPEDRLACIVPTDGTLGGEAPALRVDDHAATLVQPVEDSDGNSSHLSGSASCRARSSTAGGPGRAAGREASAGFGWPRWFDRHPSAVKGRALLPTEAGVAGFSRRSRRTDRMTGTGRCRFHLQAGLAARSGALCRYPMRRHSGAAS